MSFFFKYIFLEKENIRKFKLFGLTHIPLLLFAKIIKRSKYPKNQTGFTFTNRVFEKFGVDKFWQFVDLACFREVSFFREKAGENFGWGKI